MLQKVFKYPVPTTDTFTILMPKDAQILTVQVQNPTTGAVCMWVLVDVDVPQEFRHFRLVGTGYPILESIIKYIGTFQVNDGQLVFHLFEIVKENANANHS